MPDDSAITIGTGEDLQTEEGPGDFSLCFRIGPTGGSSEAVETKDCKLSPKEQARIEREEREHREAVAPAPGSSPRLVAQLSLGSERQSVLKLAAWRARGNLLCLEYEVVEGDDAFGFGPFGACDPYYTCSGICLDEADYGRQHRIAAVGAVDAAADEIRFTSTNGQQIRYPLAGPRIPGSDRRVFLGDVGTRSYSRVELIRDREVIAKAGPAISVRWQECAERLRGKLVTEERFRDEFAECMRRRD